MSDPETTAASPLTVETVVDKYIAIRDKRAADKKVFEEQDSKLKAIQERLEGWLLNKSNEVGVDSFTIKGVGTAYRGRDMKVSCKDWQTFENWLIETRQLAFFERRISRDTVKKYMEANDGKQPPVLDIIYEDTFNVRRATGNKEKS